MKRLAMPTGLLAAVALIVLSAFAAGSASAVPQFLSTGPLPGLLLILGANKQFFSTNPGGASFECEHFRAHGSATNGQAMTAKEVIVTGVYSKCKTVGGLTAIVTPVEYLLTAEGTVSVIGKPIVITVAAAGCSIKVRNGSTNENLKTIRYLPDGANPGAILVHAEVTGIHSEGSGGPVCGEAGVEQTTGEYRGLFLVFLDGGTIKWDP